MESADDERLAERRAHDLATQQVIDAFAEEAPSGPLPEVVRVLQDRLADAGVTGMPEPWLETVAAGIRDGNAYVVSALTDARLDVPPPATDVPDETVT